MKALIKAAVVAAVLAAPVVSFAQSNEPLTRAQVREELVQLQKAGYSPLDDRNSYPVHIQAAEARIAAQNGTTPVNTSYGPATKGSSQAGARAEQTGPQSVFFGN
ncbi:DUF4148 domain-containing protein [Paraburkholderia saeva]|uniref:DUF4148 domain-containing protein n=1 Tax=Paraburkholderia saeva TaxID=2777537 RepID=A0A9N8X0N7_9BURK|nr:DUF4148 domain-containing protein [Paraburkholderia saeva]CAG4887235.1 hypothetical protein R52603_00369 [Paraburkholderia saeva]CAG4894778.1 hypothetical protein LMG31841_01989 [Paraburkholderia saeva]CAG4898393.1 hypothetical protein R70241_02468 [Paraburkholderia saeva]